MWAEDVRPLLRHKAEEEQLGISPLPLSHGDALSPLPAPERGQRGKAGGMASGAHTDGTGCVSDAMGVLRSRAGTSQGGPGGDTAQVGEAEGAVHRGLYHLGRVSGGLQKVPREAGRRRTESQTSGLRALAGLPRRRPSDRLFRYAANPAP